ncbi:MAG: hypothetical protein AAF639_22070 [Chloroflexota bacterium]
MSKNLELLLIPILLDFFLWITPRLSIAPFLEQVAGFYLEFAAEIPEAAGDTQNSSGDPSVTPETITEFMTQFADILTSLGQDINLFNFLVSSSLMHVPSLVPSLGLETMQMLSESMNRPLQINTIDQPLSIIMLSLLLGTIGIFIGVVYMGMLVRYLPIGIAPKHDTWDDFLRQSIRHWGQIVLFVVSVFFILLMISIPISIGVALLTIISPAIGSFLMFLMSGGVVILFFYLTFVTAGIVMDDLPLLISVRQSFRLVKNHFWRTLGFVMLTNLIYMGFYFLLGQLVVAYQPIGGMVAIALNAYISTGLVMALLVFYRTRLIKVDAETVFGSE